MDRAVILRALNRWNIQRKIHLSPTKIIFSTSIPGIFACGDVTNRGAGIAIAAIAEAQKAAAAAHALSYRGDTSCTDKNEDNTFYSKRDITKEEIREEYAFRNKRRAYSASPPAGAGTKA